MMSERKAVIVQTVEVSVGWTEVFSCATKLLADTQPADVRWVHVERAKAIYDGMKALFDAKINPDALCNALFGHSDAPRRHRCRLPAGHEGRHVCSICGLYWETENARPHAEAVADSVQAEVGNLP